MFWRQRVDMSFHHIWFSFFTVKEMLNDILASAQRRATGGIKTLYLVCLSQFDNLCFCNQNGCFLKTLYAMLC